MIRQWLIATLVRAVKTACQTALGICATYVYLGEADWGLVFSAAGMAALCSVLTSCAGIPEVDGGASLPKMIGGGDA